VIICSPVTYYKTVCLLTCLADDTFAHYWSVGQMHSWSIDTWWRLGVQTWTFLDCCVWHDGEI